MLDSFPVDRLLPRRRHTHLVGSTLRGGRTFGFYQTETELSGGIWRDEWRGLRISRDDYRRLMATWAARLRGGRPVIMRLTPDILHAGRMVTYAALPFAVTPFAFRTGLVTAQAASNAGVRARSLDLTVSGAALVGAERFSVNHAAWGWRVYEIAEATPTAPGAYTITFEPGLREAVTAGEALEFNAPRCVMKLADETSLAAPLTTDFSESINPVFVEYVGKP